MAEKNTYSVKIEVELAADSATDANDLAHYLARLLQQEPDVRDATRGPAVGPFGQVEGAVR